MQEKDGWKRVRPTLPDSRIINKAHKAAKKSHRHHDIHVRGSHYEYYFERVARQNSIIYRRLHYREMIEKKKKLIKRVAALTILPIVGYFLYQFFVIM